MILVRIDRVGCLPRSRPRFRWIHQPAGSKAVPAQRAKAEPQQRHRLKDRAVVQTLRPVQARTDPI